MNMSKACLPPIHAPISENDRNHPRFKEYQNYRSAMACQLVACQPFKSWLSSMEHYERGSTTVYQVNLTQAERDEHPNFFLANGWYKGVNLPNGKGRKNYGPFATKQEAENA